METARALLRVHALDVEVVREVERHSVAKFYRNDVLTGHGVRWGVRISWTVKEIPLAHQKYHQHRTLGNKKQEKLETGT